MKYPTIRIEGAILAAEVLEKIEQGEMTGQKPGDFNIQDNSKVKDEIARAWADAQSYWGIFKRKREALDEDERQTGTSETRSQWMIPFLGILGYKLDFSKAEEVHGKSYAVSHRDNILDGFPAHIMGFKDNLDKKRVDGGPRMSPHALVQEYLNLTEHLFAIVTNGLQLRLLRDSSRLIKLSFLEFDLERMMEEEQYADFALLYRLLHVSRMPVKQEATAESLIETYHQNSLESGSRIRDGLSKAVETSILQFANGFLQHPANTELKRQIQGGKITPQEFYQWQLRLIYRLLFLMVIEERDLIFPTEANKKHKKYYYNYYSLNKLRKLSEKRFLADSKHNDFWESILNTFRLFEDERYGKAIGIAPLAGTLFGYNAIGKLNNCLLDNKVVLGCLRNLSIFKNEKTNQLMRVNYASLNVEEFGSVYEGLLEYDPTIAVRNGKLHFEFVLGDGRSSSGSHYTPDELVQPLIKHSLTYIIEDKLKEVDQEKALLSITVCDVACGSGHILLNAARKIATELAIVRTGEEQPSPSAFREAIKDVIRHCIYGVDLNPLAVELCKVALWLEAHNPNEPLNFLDHHIKCGNAIVGLAHFKELENGIANEAFKTLTDDEKEVAAAFNKTNAQERKTAKQLSTFDLSSVDDSLKGLRKEFADFQLLPENTLQEITHKSKVYNELSSGKKWYRLKQLADIQVAQFFIPKTTTNKESLTTDSKFRTYLNSGTTIYDRGSSASMAEEKRFFHWFLEFPQVFGDGGFDCVLGNPPYLGGKKISGAYGSQFLNWAHFNNKNIKGQADLVTYFLRRIYDIVCPTGFLSLVTTNSIAEGDTRIGGIKHLIDLGGEISHATKSVRWPGVANLFVSKITFSKSNTRKLLKELNGKHVDEINSLLNAGAETTKPFSLKANSSLMFRGVDFGGKGFIITDSEYESLLKSNPKNSDVLYSLMNGQDFNNDINQKGTRYIINSRDSDLESLKKYTEPFKILLDKVKPYRDSVKDKRAQEYWWKYNRSRPALYKKLDSVENCLITGFTSKYMSFAFCNKNTIFSNALNVLVSDSNSIFSIVQSNIHETWVRKYASKLKNDLRYTPSDVFDTFPFPKEFNSDSSLITIGEKYHALRKRIMLDYEFGLTSLYNHFHDIESNIDEISELRKLHVQLDILTLKLYDWSDLQLEHEFYEVESLPKTDRIRFTISGKAKEEIHSRLLGLNMIMHKNEVEEGLINQGGKKKIKTEKLEKVVEPIEKNGQQSMFDEPNLFNSPSTISEESKVIVLQEDGKKLNYHISKKAKKGVFTNDYKQINSTSKLAEVMLGRKVNDFFQFGGVKYKILEVK